MRLGGSTFSTGAPWAAVGRGATCGVESPRKAGVKTSPLAVLPAGNAKTGHLFGKIAALNPQRAKAKKLSRRLCHDGRVEVRLVENSSNGLAEATLVQSPAAPEVVHDLRTIGIA